MFALVLFVHFRSHMVLGFWSRLDHILSFVSSLVLFQSGFVHFRSHMVCGSWSRFDHVISFVPSLVLLRQSRLFCLVCARFRTLHFSHIFFLFARLFSHICLRPFVFARLFSLFCFRSFASARLPPLVCLRS